MSPELIAGVSTVVTALVGAVAAAWVTVQSNRAGTKQREKDDTIREYEKIIGRYEKDIQRREAHEINQQEVIHTVQESNARLRERYADVRGRYEMIYQYAKRQFQFMKKQGIDAEPPPMEEMPPPPPVTPEGSSDMIDVAVRKMEQTSTVLKKTRPVPPEGVIPEVEDEGAGHK